MGRSAANILGFTDGSTERLTVDVSSANPTIDATGGTLNLQSSGTVGMVDVSRVHFTNTAADIFFDHATQDVVLKAGQTTTDSHKVMMSGFSGDASDGWLGKWYLLSSAGTLDADVGLGVDAAGVIAFNDGKYGDDNNIFLMIGGNTEPGDYVNAGDTDGDDVWLKAQGGGTHTAGDPDGGDIIIEPGVFGAGGSGADGKIRFVRPAGTPGTDEASISWGGGSKNHLQIQNHDNGNLFLYTSTTGWGISSGSSPDFTPGVTGCDVGSTTAEVQALYLSEDASSGIYWGLDQDHRTFYDATAAALKHSNGLSFTNSAEGDTASLNIKIARESHTLANAATSTTSIDLGSNVLVLGVGLNVDTAVVDDGGDDTWSSNLDDGADIGTISTGSAAAQNTKVDKLFVPILTDATTNVKFTANGGNFSAGVIEVLVYYIDLTSLANQ